MAHAITGGLGMGGRGMGNLEDEDFQVFMVKR